MLHLYGNILTNYGVAANNHGENEGNIAQLQKLLWKSETHTTVSAEAIRWALRYYWQLTGYEVNRRWDDNINDCNRQNQNFDAVQYIDDDVLGFMRPEAAKVEIQPEKTSEEETSNVSKRSKNKTKKIPGTTTARRGVLEVNRAVSISPYDFDITFNAVSGKKGRTSLYGTEIHATCYQYGFALTPERLKEKSRINAVLDGLISIGEVAGNHAHFLYDFSPKSIVLRWTHDFSPRILYSFERDETGNISIPDLVRRVKSEDIDPQELWIGGAISESLEDLGAKVFPGVKSAVKDLKQVIANDLQLSQINS